MDSNALVQLAADTLACSQKELAVRLGVSPAQISKWKKGDYMSAEMEDKLRAISSIGERVPEFVVWAGSLDNATKWERLLSYLVESAVSNSETGYHTPPLEEQEQRNLLYWDTFRVLREMGVDIPKQFPSELDIDYDVSHDSPDSDEPWELLMDNDYSSLIYLIYKSLTDVYGFYAAYVSDFMYDDDLELDQTAACNIEPCLLSLAASKLEDAPTLAPRFVEFKRLVKKEYEEWLSIVKDKVFRAGMPLRAELLGMVYNSHDELGHEAEAESLGFNASRVHPDIYMNELLCGMRTMHQVLPAIMKKLGIYDDFTLDESEFRIG